jgi:hypothetical protein
MGGFTPMKGKGQRPSSHLLSDRLDQAIAFACASRRSHPILDDDLRMEGDGEVIDLQLSVAHLMLHRGHLILDGPITPEKTVAQLH